jgi:hypothetical protein
MKTFALWISLAALLGVGVATAHALHCTTQCIGNICYTNCY